MNVKINLLLNGECIKTKQAQKIPKYGTIRQVTGNKGGLNGTDYGEADEKARDENIIIFSYRRQELLQ